MIVNNERVIRAFEELFNNKTVPLDILINQIGVNIDNGKITEEEGLKLKLKFNPIIEEAIIITE